MPENISSRFRDYFGKLPGLLTAQSSEEYCEQKKKKLIKFNTERKNKAGTILPQPYIFFHLASGNIPTRTVERIPLKICKCNGISQCLFHPERIFSGQSAFYPIGVIPELFTRYRH